MPVAVQSSFISIIDKAGNTSLVSFCCTIFVITCNANFVHFWENSNALNFKQVSSNTSAGVLIREFFYFQDLRSVVDALKNENIVSAVHASKRFCCELSFDHFNIKCCSFITGRNSSCGKFMFSQASVMSHIGREVYIISYWNALSKIVSSN